MEKIAQIAGIILFFTLAAFVITYPYELAYTGTEDIKPIDESYEYTSIEQVLDRPEFKNKVLYIRIGEPLEDEIINPKKYEPANSNQVIVKEDGEKAIVHSRRLPYEYQLQTLKETRNRYKDKGFEMVFLSDSDSDVMPKSPKKKKEDLRKWKSIIKKYKIAGHHFIMSPEFYSDMVVQLKEIKKNGPLFPHNVIIGRHGILINNNALSPSYEKERLYKELDSIILQ